MNKNRTEVTGGQRRPTIKQVRVTFDASPRWGWSMSNVPTIAFMNVLRLEHDPIRMIRVVFHQPEKTVADNFFATNTNPDEVLELLRILNAPVEVAP